MTERTPPWVFGGLLALAVLVLAGGFLASRAARAGSGAGTAGTASTLSTLAPGLVSLEIARIERTLAPGAPAPALAPGEELVADGAEQLVVTSRRAFDLADVTRSVDNAGYPALLVEVREFERAALEAWSAAHVGDVVLLRVSGVTCRPLIMAPIKYGQVLLAQSAVEPARYQRELLTLLGALGR